MDSRGAAPVGGSWSGIGRSLVRNDDCSIVLQLIEAAVGDNVSRIDAVNLGYPAVGNSRLYAAHMSEIVLDHIHKRCLAILLNGGCRNQRHSLQCIHQQMGVNKLVLGELIILV